jgi:hypothetical protein
MPEYLKHSDAVKLIFDRAPNLLQENKRAWVNKIRVRLTRAIQSGDIRQNEASLLCLDDILRHAIKWYGVEHFQDCPIPSINGCLSVTTEAATLSGINIQLPDNNQELQALAVKQYTEIMRLKEVVAQLEPDAFQYRKICVTNRKNAKRKREK